MNRPAIFMSLALVVGVLIGAWIQSDSESINLEATTAIQNTATVAGDSNVAKKPGTDRSTIEMRELKQLLQNEISARQSLQQKFEVLSRQLNEFEANMQFFSGAKDSEQVANDNKSDVSVADDNWFNVQALIDSGMANTRASELKAYFEQLEIERLYLRDQSIRESWDRQKYRDARLTLANKEDDLKNQLSESEYNAYLYASGQANRVAVTSVLASAQAGIAGIMPGDHVIRYDNQRIYNGFDLREATSGGNIDDSVALEVERDGETLQFYLPRGPLGIRMNSVSVAP